MEGGIKNKVIEKLVGNPMLRNIIFKANKKRINQKDEPYILKIERVTLISVSPSKRLLNRVVCGSMHTGSLFAHMFVGPCKETYLSSFNQIHFFIPTSFERIKITQSVIHDRWEIPIKSFSRKIWSV